MEKNKKMRRYASIFYTTKDISKISTQLTQSKKGEKRNAKKCDKIKENRQLKIFIKTYKFG